MRRGRHIDCKTHWFLVWATRAKSRVKGTRSLVLVPPQEGCSYALEGST